ncbi:DedA family protein [Kitasatospora aburaviensis]
MALTPARMERADGFFARHGGKVVTVARFVDGLRQTNGIIAGTTEMPWRRFQPFNVLGAALWVGVWSAFGYLAGTNIGTIYRAVVRYQLWLLFGLLAVCALLAVRAVLRRRRGARRRSGPGRGRGQGQGQGRPDAPEPSGTREPAEPPEPPEPPERREPRAPEDPR